MNIKYLPFSFLFLLQTLLFLIYFFLNIKNVGNAYGVGFIYAVCFFGISVVILYRQLLKYKLIVKYSFLLMILLWLWIAFRIVIDIGSTEYLKQSFFATTGGVIFFYLSGFFLSTVVFEMFRIVLRVKYKAKGFFISCLFIVFIVSFIGYIVLLVNFESRLSSRFFVIQGLNGKYQRSGNFLSILFLFTSYLFFLLIIQVPYLLRKVRPLFSLFLFFIYLIIVFLSSIIAQMMGSNSAFVVISGVGLITLVISSFVVSPRNISNYFILKSKVINISIVAEIICRFIFLFIFIMLIVVSLIILLDFDLNSIRFTGYGLQTNTSIDSRVGIIKNNFVIQFSDSPILGNYNVDAETTGIGTYIHSFFLHTLTHTGLIGFISFICFFSMLFYSLLKSNSLFSINQRILSVEKPLRLYSLMVLIFLLLVANVGTVLTWPVLWFGIGLFGQLLNFNK